MISLRRTLTVALGFLLLAFLLLAIVSCQIGATVLSADFYKDRLLVSNLYTFALTDLPLTIVGEIRGSIDGSSDLDEFLSATSGLSDEEVVDSLNRVLSPSWLQGFLEPALDEIVPYVAGDRDEFRVVLNLSESSETTIEEVKYLLRESNAYAHLSGRIGTMVAEEIVDPEHGLELGVSIDRITQAVMNVVTADWLQAQIERSLDEIAPYLRGESNTFEVSLEISEIARRGSAEAKDLLHEARVYDILYEKTLKPTIAASLDIDSPTPSGVDVTEQDLLRVIKVAAPDTWFREQVERLVDESADWILGASPEMRVVIDLRDNKRVAHSALLDLTRAKAEEYLAECPESLTKLSEALTGAGMQSCRALSDAGAPEIDEAVSTLIDHLGPEIETHVQASIPDFVHFTDQDILWGASDISEGRFASLLRDARQVALRAQSFTEDDLKERLDAMGGQSANEIMEQVRRALSGDLTWTEQDLISTLESQAGDEGLQGFQKAQTWISRVQSLRWLAWIPIIVLLISIGLLGGRNWPGRVTWAATYMVGIAALLFAAFRALRSMWNSRIEDSRVEALGQIEQDSRFAASEELITDKVFEIVTDAGNVFIDGLARQSLMSFLTGLALIACVVGWRYWSARTDK